jgi:hypothetical protein
VEADARHVHVYADGRGFVVVPVTQDPDGTPVEVTPVERVSLTLGRATSVELTRALRRAARRSAAEGDDDLAAWDGDDGRWWSHNLLFVKLAWTPEGVTLTPQRPTSPGAWEDAGAESLPPTTPSLEIAQHLIEYLGQRLHG